MKRQGGFSLVELAMVLTLLGILAGISSVSIRAAMLAARVGAEIAELATLRNAVVSLGVDCASLPAQSNLNDPGLAARPAWARSCWRGPYLTRWLTSTRLGGRYRYVGQRNRKPVMRVELISEAAARSLANAIRHRYGTGALGSVARSGSSWQVDMILNDAITVP